MAATVALREPGRSGHQRGWTGWRLAVPRDAALSVQEGRLWPARLELNDPEVAAARVRTGPEPHAAAARAPVLA
jgi:hypothetical protein